MENNDKEKSGLMENLEAVGQMILGGAEAIGGIITADPITRAEGDFNVGAGAAHQEANLVSEAIEHKTRENTVDNPDFNQGSGH